MKASSKKKSRDTGQSPRMPNWAYMLLGAMLLAFVLFIFPCIGNVEHANAAGKTQIVVTEPVITTTAVTTTPTVKTTAKTTAKTTTKTTSKSTANTTSAVLTTNVTSEKVTSLVKTTLKSTAETTSSNLTTNATTTVASLVKTTVKSTVESTSSNLTTNATTSTVASLVTAPAKSTARTTAKTTTKTTAKTTVQTSAKTTVKGTLKTTALTTSIATSRILKELPLVITNGNVHWAYLSPSKGLFSFVSDKESQEAIAVANDLTVNSSFPEGWYAIPNGIACKIETKGYISQGKGWGSLNKNPEIQELIAEANGLTLDSSFTAGWYTIPANIACEPYSYLKQSKPLVTMSEETTTAPAVAETESISYTLADETIPVSEVENQYDFNFEEVNFDEIFPKDQIGFAFGTANETVIAYNADKYFSLDCIAKAVEVTYMAQLYEKYGIDPTTEMVQIKAEDRCWTTYMWQDEFAAGKSVSLYDCNHAGVSLSDNQGHRTARRYFKEKYNIDTYQWAITNFGRIKDGGMYGKNTANGALKEAQYVLNYINSGAKYSEMVKYFLEDSFTYYESEFLDQIDSSNAPWKAFKIGWYNDTATEMVFFEDAAGNFYCGALLTDNNGSVHMQTLGGFANEILACYK